MAEFQEVMRRYIRMCVNSRCNTCPLQNKAEEIYECRMNYDCLRFLKEQPEAAEKTINDWAEENPEETWKTKLKKVLPNCNIDYLNNCPYDMFGGNAPGAKDKDCDGNCIECWNREATE